MKAIRKIFFPCMLATCLLTSVTGCSGFLEVNSDKELSDKNALEELNDYDMATLGAYESMRTEYYCGLFNKIVMDAMSDNMVLNYEGRKTYNEFADFKFSSNTYGLEGFWSQAYNAILSTNVVIEKLEQEPNDFAGTENEAAAKNLLAECLVLRGYIHFDLVRSFATDYKKANETSLGIPYKTNSEITTPSRNTVKEVYSYIVSDMTKGISLMEDAYNANNNSRVNKKSANALLARVYLTMGDNANAIACAGKAITGDGSDLCEPDDFVKLFSTSMERPEVLFRLAVTAGDNYQPGAAWGQGAVTSYKSEYCVSYNLGQLYQSNDARRAEVKSVQLEDKSYLVPWKYNGRDGEAQAGVVDLPVVRVAEMYLTRAEAYYNSNEQGKALIDLNLVCAKRYKGFEDGTESGQVLERAIQLERRLELAFEGDRFYTLKRRGEELVRDGKGHYADGTGNPAATQEVSASSPFWLLAIPQSEINANPNMVQNQY